jgi:hypothetical protein
MLNLHSLFWSLLDRPESYRTVYSSALYSFKGSTGLKSLTEPLMMMRAR